MVPAESVTTDTEAKDALESMRASGKCFLAVVDKDGTLKGWLALCHLFREREEDLTHQLDSLASYLAADGPGG
jgi:hypothetical protein